MRLAVVWLPCLMLWGSEALCAQVPAAAAAQPATVQPGDRIRIIVWQNDEMTGDFEVTADGTLLHPLYRDVQLSGASLAAVEERLRSYLTRLDANVRFVMQPLVRVAVAGEVQAPNLYHHPSHVTIAQAIALAGGATELGRLDQVRLSRGGAVHYLDLRDTSSAAAQMPVQSGDEIIVERRRSVLRDVIGPASSVIAAVSSLVVLILRF